MTIEQVPASVRSGHLAARDGAHTVPALIADVGEQASWRYVEFFTANIRNRNTRHAAARVCEQFFSGCEEHGLALETIQPFDVTAYVEAPQYELATPSVKQPIRRGPYAVRLAGGRPDRAEQPRGVSA